MFLNRKSYSNIVLVVFFLLLTQYSQLPTPNSQLYAAQLNIPENLSLRRTLYLDPQASAPAGPVEGQIYYNSGDNQVYFYDGAVWQSLTGKDRAIGTKIVAASNSLDTTRADYVCDGTADEVEIQAAIDSLGLSGGSVYLLEGTYNISASINLDNSAPDDSNKSIIGSGRGTALMLAAGSSNVRIFNCSNTSGILISQLKIDGNSLTGTSNVGISFSSVTSSKIDKIWIEGLDSSGGVAVGAVSLNSSSENIIFGNTLRNNTAAIYSQNSSNNNISGNSISGNSSSAINFSASFNNNISGNQMVNNNASNIVFDSTCYGNSIFGNNIISTAAFSSSGGVQIQGSRNSIIGNNVQGHKAAIGGGIVLSSPIGIETCFGNIVLANNVQSNTGDGIRLYSADSNVVSNNIIYDSGTWGGFVLENGISLMTGSASNIISSNVFYDNLGVGYPIYIWDAPCINNYVSANLVTFYMANYGFFVDLGANTKYTDKVKITIERQAAVVPVNGGTLDASSSPKGYIPLAPASPITLSAVTAISDGKAIGDLLILEGTSDVNTVAVQNNANTRLNAGVRTLGLEDTLKLIWDGGDWVEIGYSNN